MISRRTCLPCDSTCIRLVTGRFEHSSAEVLNLYVEGEQTPIGTTASHPFWSQDRQAFVSAESLTTTERLRLEDGRTAAVNRIEQLPGTQSVYNLEVNGEHVYHIGLNGVLVHNECAFERFVSPLEARRAVDAQGLHIDPGFNGKWKNIADAGKFDPKTLGPKSGKFFGEKITITVRDGARAWLRQKGVTAPLGHPRQCAAQQSAAKRKTLRCVVTVNRFWQRNSAE